jgi:hypothetical protein
LEVFNKEAFYDGNMGKVISSSYTSKYPYAACPIAVLDTTMPAGAIRQLSHWLYWHAAFVFYNIKKLKAAFINDY